MIKWFIQIVAIIVIGEGLVAQTDSVHRSRNTIYLEAGGAGGYGSVNYERMVFIQQKISFIARCGVSSYHIIDYTKKINPDILIPFSLGACYGKCHKVEGSVGQTIASTVHAVEGKRNPQRIQNFHTFFSMGYRYQNDTGGLLLRLSYTPIIEFNKHLRHWAGISLGYSF